MRWINKLIVLVLEVFVVCLALNALLAGWFGMSASPIVSLVPEVVRPTGPWTERGYWLALLSLPVLHALILFRIYRRERAIVFQTSPTDSLSLTRSAVTQCVRTELAEVPAIVKHKVIISQAGRRAIDLRIELRVKPIENIPEMQARLGRQIRRSLSEILGLENIRHIKVNVTSIEEPRKRRSDSPVPVARRLSGPETSARTAAATGGAAVVSATGSEEPTDAEFSVDDDDDLMSRYSRLTGEGTAEAADAGGGTEPTPEPTPELESERPREIELGESDAGPQAIEIKDDDELLKIIGRSESDDERKSP